MDQNDTQADDNSKNDAALEEKAQENPEQAINEEAKAEEEGSSSKLKPWVDYIPEFTLPYKETLPERIDFHIGLLSDYLKEQELKTLGAVDSGANRSYKRMWKKDANNIFRSIVNLRHRKARLKDS